MTVTEAANRGEIAGLALIADLVDSLVGGDPIDTTLGLICRKICKLIGFRFAGVLVPSDGWSQFRLAGHHGFPPEYIERLAEMFLVPVGEQQRESPTRQSAELRRTIVTPDVLEVPEFTPWRGLAIRFGFRSMVSVPLMADGDVIGVLNGYSANLRAFTPDELASIETLAAQAAVSLRVSLLLDSRQETIRHLRDSNEALERQRRTLERAHEIHQRLTAAALSGTSTEAVARALSELVGRPVAITHPDGSLRSSSPALAHPDEHPALLAALPIDAEGGDSPAFTIAEIRIPGERLGHVVIPRGDEQAADLDRRAVEHAATVLALEAVKARVVQATEDRLRSDFLADLFRGRLDDDPDVVERAHRHGLDVGTGHRVVIVRIDQQVDALPSGALVRAELLRTVGTMVVGTGPTITAVVPAEGAGGSPEGLRARLEEARSRLGAGTSLSAGIGPVARRIDEFAASHYDADICLDLSRRLGRPGLIVAREELGILSLFVDTRNPEQLTANARRVLGPAMEYDRERSGELVATLAAYLDNGCSTAGTARALFVHPNTVKYRLRQVETLCGLQLRDPEDLLQARIATLTLALL
jgi:sugar diacid utilization regulator